MTLCILGRQPALGRAELESLYGADTVSSVGTAAALVDAAVDFPRLGGTVKTGEMIAEIPGANPQKAFLWLQKNIADIVQGAEGKLKLGVSLYDMKMPDAKLNANVLSLKKILRDTGRSVRTVPSKDGELSSAQSFHNNMAGDKGCELLLVADGDRTLIARLTHVQDIDAYRKRDQERPRRDTYVGMLPPKLAQIIINVAAADKRSGVVLDPFCGTGVLLQEAKLMRFATYGTDIEEKMVRYTRDNLNWLGMKNDVDYDMMLETADATDHIWRKPVDIVACEGYLGHPFSTEPNREALMETIQTSNVVMHKFLRNIAEQLEPGTRLCIAAPAWHVKGQIHHLPVITKLTELGYEHVDFTHTKRSDLIYHRPGQVVGRELLVLVKR